MPHHRKPYAEVLRPRQGQGVVGGQDAPGLPPGLKLGDVVAGLLVNKAEGAGIVAPVAAQELEAGPAGGGPVGVGGEGGHYIAHLVVFAGQDTVF